MTSLGKRYGRLLATAPVSNSALVGYEDLAGRQINFEPQGFEEAEADRNWRVDRRQCRLASEAPGPPLDDGPFAVARKVFCGYHFADPAIVRAVYDPSGPLEGRDMLLVGRFYGLRLHMGVRIHGVEDESREVKERPVRRLGFRYRTLEGHVERGQMDYELVKWLDTGEIDFRMRAYSQRACIENTLLRWGFLLFGRSVQLKFYARSLDRMKTIVAAQSSPRDGDLPDGARPPRELDEPPST